MQSGAQAHRRQWQVRVQQPALKLPDRNRTTAGLLRCFWETLKLGAGAGPCLHYGEEVVQDARLQLEARLVERVCMDTGAETSMSGCGPRESLAYWANSQPSPQLCNRR